MPDFDLRSRASFISSKEGGTPASVSRSWMKRRSSNCLRVSIYLSPSGPTLIGFKAETNHERALYVRYVFRNCLIWSEKLERPLKGQLRENAVGTGSGRRCVRLPNHQAVGLGEWRHQGTVLGRQRGGHQTVRTFRQGGPQVVRSLIIGREVTPKACPLGPRLNVITAGKAPDQGYQKQKGADVRRDGISRHTQDLHCTQPAMHHRPARAQRD